MKVRVRGLYGPTMLFEAADVAEAKKWYHGNFPGLRGTILGAEEVTDAELDTQAAENA